MIFQFALYLLLTSLGCWAIVWLLLPALPMPSWMTASRQRKAQQLVLIAGMLTIVIISVLQPRPQQKFTVPAKGWLAAADVEERSATQGWGTLHIDRSIGDNPLRIRGVTYDEGFGTHAPSIINIAIPSSALTLTGMAGIDDEVISNPAHVAFEILVDGQSVWKSGPVDPGQAPHSFSINVSSKKSLQLRVDDLGNMDFDHADWVRPRFLFAAPKTGSPTK